MTSDMSSPENILEIDAGKISGLVLDLQAASFASPPDGVGLEGAWLDSSGNGNHLEEIDGPGPTLVENVLNGHPVVRFAGDSVLSMAGELIRDEESYTVFCVARYCGEKKGRVISSTNNNWLFGFHEGNVESWFAGSWLSHGRESPADEWQVQSAVVDLQGENTFESWDNGRIVCEGNFSDGTAFSTIGKLSVGGWRNSGEQVSDCEIARILVFDVAISNQLRRHIELQLGIIYSIGDMSASEYVTWSESLGESIREYPLIGQTAAELALSRLDNPELALIFLNQCEYSDGHTQKLIASAYASLYQSEEALKHRYVEYFLGPNDIGATNRLLTAKKKEGIMCELLDYFQLINSHCIAGNSENILEEMDEHLLTVNGAYNDPLQGVYEENEQLLRSGRFNDFFVMVNRGLKGEVSDYSELVSARIGNFLNEVEIRRIIIDRLNDNSGNELVIRFSTEFFKFEKRRYVGGFADRLKGATTAMLLSIATGRRFEIEWKYPFELEEVLVPVDYDWRIRDSDVDLERVVLIDSYFTQSHRDAFSSGGIEEALGITGNSAELYCNIFHSDCLENPALEGEFAKLSEFSSQPNMVGTLLSMLDYRPDMIECSIVKNFLQYLDMFDESIAVHFRTGGDGDWEDPDVDSEDNVVNLFQEARRIIEESGKSTCVYFATDSNALKKKILDEYGSELHVFSVNIPLAHIDRSSGSNQIIGSRFAIMENYLISLCDHILAGKGAFSVLAANRRFEWPWRYFKTH
mgnify:CR=1 FL=1